MRSTNDIAEVLIAGEALNAIDESHKQTRWSFIRKGSKDAAFYNAYKNYHLLDKKQKEHKVYFEYKRPNANNPISTSDILRALALERRGLYKHMLADPRVRNAVTRALSLPNGNLDVIRRTLERGNVYDQLSIYSKVLSFLTSEGLYDKRYDYYVIGFRNVPHHYWLTSLAKKLLGRAKS